MFVCSYIFFWVCRYVYVCGLVPKSIHIKLCINGLFAKNYWFNHECFESGREQYNKNRESLKQKKIIYWTKVKEIRKRRNWKYHLLVYMDWCYLTIGMSYCKISTHYMEFKNMRKLRVCRQNMNLSFWIIGIIFGTKI